MTILPGETNGSVENEITQMQDQMYNVEKELNVYRAKPQKIDELKKAKATYGSDMGKFQNLITQLQQKKDAIVMKIKEKQQRLNEFGADTTKYNNMKEMLLRQISQQEISSEDVERMSNERMRLEDELKVLSKKREELMDKNKKLVFSLQQEREQLQRLAQEYNQQASVLQLIPITAKNANGFQYELVLNNMMFASDSSENAILTNIDMKQVKRKLKDLKETFGKRYRESAENTLKAKEQLSHVQRQYQDKHDEIVDLEQKFERLRMECENQKELGKNERKQQQCEVEAIEDEINQIKNGIQSSEIHAVEEQIERAQQEQVLMQQRATQEREYMNDLLIKTLEIMTIHKDAIQGSIMKVEKECKQVFTNLMGNNETNKTQ